MFGYESIIGASALMGYETQSEPGLQPGRGAQIVFTS
jgi:hypothetical protein